MTLDLFLYTEQGSNLNLCGPFVSLSIYIDPQTRPIIQELFNSFSSSSNTRIRNISLSSMLQCIGALEHLQYLHSLNSLSPPFFLSSVIIPASLINYLGSYICVSRSEHRALIQLKSKLISLEDTLPSFNSVSLHTEDDIRNHLEGLILYFYARSLRQRYFDNYHLIYPQLDLINNVGHSNPKHLYNLAQLPFLPHFYLWAKTIQFIKSSSIDCNWLNHELSSYERLK